MKIRDFDPLYIWGTEQKWQNFQRGRPAYPEIWAHGNLGANFGRKEIWAQAEIWAQTEIWAQNWKFGRRIGNLGARKKFKKMKLYNKKNSRFTFFLRHFFEKFSFYVFFETNEIWSCKYFRKKTHNCCWFNFSSHTELGVSDFGQPGSLVKTTCIFRSFAYWQKFFGIR